MKLGSLLDDQHWHQFRLDRYRQFVNLSLDGEIVRFRLNGAFEQLDLDTEVMTLRRIFKAFPFGLQPPESPGWGILQVVALRVHCRLYSCRSYLP